MRKTFSLLLIGFISCFSQVTVGFGQGTTKEIKLISTSAAEKSIAFYNQQAGAQLRLYNGTLYQNYRYAFKNGHPYFGSKEPGTGSVKYDNVLYQNIPLWYDLLRDKVIVEHADDATQISLIREKINYFTLHNHTFVYLSPDSVTGTPLAEGFYDQLYQGQVSLLAKRSVKMMQKTVPGSVERTLNPQVRYYLKQNGQYYPVKNQGALVKQFKEKKKAVQQYARENNLGYAEDRESGLIKLVAYYDSLKN